MTKFKMRSVGCAIAFASLSSLLFVTQAFAQDATNRGIDAAHPSTTKPVMIKLGPLNIEAPWTRATPNGAKVGGGYMKITNTGQEPDRLVGGSLPMAGRFEVHEMAVTDGVMRMRELGRGLEIKSGQTVELKPGGFHIMFMDLKEPLKQGANLKGTLVFEKAGKVDVEYQVAPIGATTAGAHSHH